jgi:patatin-related protein
LAARLEFIARNFERYSQMNVDVASVPFIDGSVLNSRPFREAITAIQGHPAYREVDRRVIYVDPNPASAGSPAHHGVPGFFLTLKGALSDIPLAEPVTDELAWIARFNERARRFGAVISSARPQISQLVADVMASGHDERVTENRIRSWREQANLKAARDAGFAYEAYVRLKLASVRDFVSQLIMGIRGVRPGSPFARAIAEIVDAWAIQAGVTYKPPGSRSQPAEAMTVSDVNPKWVAFLLAFDVDYRKRRLRFLVERPEPALPYAWFPGSRLSMHCCRSPQAQVLRTDRSAGAKRDDGVFEYRHTRAGRGYLPSGPIPAEVRRSGHMLSPSSRSTK